MKSYFAALSTTALISVAPFALAASNTHPTVKGEIGLLNGNATFQSEYLKHRTTLPIAIP